MRRILLALVIGLGFLASDPGLAAPASHPPGDFIVDTWGDKEGLPQSSVLSIVQTHDGYLWLGTLSGLIRFDGVRFTVFDEANTPGFNSSQIVYLFEDSRSNLWVGTETAGVELVRDGKVTGIGIGGGSRQTRLMSACEDTEGAVWLYTGNGELSRYFNSQVTVRHTDEGGLNRYRGIIHELDGKLWVGADWGQASVNTNAWPQANPSAPLLEDTISAENRLDLLVAGKTNGYWRLADGHVQFWRQNHLVRDLGNYPWPAENPPTAGCLDVEGNLIVGTFGDGVYWYNPDGTTEHIPVTQLPVRAYVASLCMDREGSLWVGTDGKHLYRIRHSPFHTLPESRGKVVKSVAEDKQGGLWIGYNNGGAAYLAGGHLREFGIDDGLLNRDVWSVFVDQSDTVWAGTWGPWSLFRYENGRFQPVAGPSALQGAVLAIDQDPQGRLWFGTQNGLLGLEGNGWTVLTNSNGLASDAIDAITSGGGNELWMGTMGGGLSHLQETGLTTFRKSPDGLPSDNISSVYLDSDGVLWVGTSGSGLARYQQGKWTHFTTRDGLASNGIGYLIEDGEGYLWIGSNAGLMRIAKSELNALAAGKVTAFHCRTYTAADGLPTRECTQGSQPGAHRSPNGTLWFPTTEGLASVDPAGLTPNTNPPPVLIESVLVDGQSQGRIGLRVPIPQSITVPPNRERLEIQYTSLNLGAPDRARFKYRMEGHETAWVDAGNARLARYSKLPPGEYRFQVIAANEDGYWNTTGDSLAIIVQPPFWRTVWFAALMGIILVGTIATTVYLVSTQKLHRRLRQQEALEKDRSRIARDLHDQLGASLTQVALLGEMVEDDKNKPTEVETHGRQISQTARDTTNVLDEIVWAVNPQNDTLDSLVTYVCKYAQDYLAVAGLRYRLEVPPSLPETPLKPEIRHNVFLATKEAITNVVKHAQATSVWLRLRLEPGQFTFEIEDDGRGLPASDKPSTRNGLQNMRKRMEDAGGTFTIGPAAKHGTMVQLTAPLDKE